jgi:outer membrane immunogenic protein
MKRIALGAVAFAAIGVAPTLAADLPAGVYTKAAPIGANYDWSGFYIGPNIGYGWGQSHDTSTITNTAGMTLFTNTDKTSMNGVVGGGQIGYNWQMQRMVVGLEADIQGVDEKGSRSFTLSDHMLPWNLPRYYSSQRDSSVHSRPGSAGDDEPEDRLVRNGARSGGRAS